MLVGILHHQQQHQTAYKYLVEAYSSAAVFILLSYDFMISINQFLSNQLDMSLNTVSRNLTPDQYK